MSPPIRVFAIVGVLVAVGLAAFLFTLPRGADDTGAAANEPLARTTRTKPAAPARPSTTRERKARPAPAVGASGYPLPIHRALRRNRVVVVAIYMPGAGVDAAVRDEARAGARAGRAGFVAVSALSERLVRPLVAKTGVLPDPAVLVIKRPGVVIATLSVTDRETVAQAVAHARR
jgi:hypothetical protein